MLKEKTMSRRTALKSVFFLSVVPGLLITSCTNSLTSPEIVDSQNSRLYKSALDSEILAAENFKVTVDSKGFAEIPKSYIYNSRTVKKLTFVLVRVEDSELALKYQLVDIVEKNGKLISIKGLSNNAILISKPFVTIKKLNKINSVELKRKFILGKNKGR